MKLQKRDLPRTAATQIRGRQRSMHPGAFRSLFCAVASALMLTAAFAPKANAQAFVPELLVYYNFNQGAGTFPTAPYLSVAPGQEIGVPLFNNSSTTNGFPSGNLFVDPTVDAGLVNRAAGDTSVTTGALDARGNTVGTMDCFTIGPFSANSPNAVNINVSFAVMSTGTGGYTTLTLAYSTNGTSFTNFATFTNLRTFTTFGVLSAFLPQAANFAPQLFIEFCFSGATNNDTHNNTYIDNLQITGLIQVPESSTAVGGLLSVVALCWYQRRRLIRSLGLRPT